MHLCCKFYHFSIIMRFMFGECNKEMLKTKPHLSVLSVCTVRTFGGLLLERILKRNPLKRLKTFCAWFGLVFRNTQNTQHKSSWISTHVAEFSTQQKSISYFFSDCFWKCQSYCYSMGCFFTKSEQQAAYHQGARNTSNSNALWMCLGPEPNIMKTVSPSLMKRACLPTEIYLFAIGYILLIYQPTCFSSQAKWMDLHHFASPLIISPQIICQMCQKICYIICLYTYLLTS